MPLLGLKGWIMIMNARIHGRHDIDWRWFLAGCVLLTLLLLTSGVGLSASLQRCGANIQTMVKPLTPHVVKEKTKPKGQKIIKDDLRGLT
jgi:hypothetical protein